MGQALSVAAQAAGRADPIEQIIDYKPLGRLRDADRKAVKYLGRRYDPSMPIETKLLLLMVEGEITMSDLVLPLTAPGHEEAVFRARVVSAFHALRAVDEILERHPDAGSPGACATRSFLAEGTTRHLVDDAAMRALRNRCVHYEIRRRLALDDSRPMFGIVEALIPTSSFREVQETLQAVTSNLATLLAQW